MRKNVEISVLVPVYNEEFFVGKTLNTLVKVLDKKEWNYEIIVINDGSTDSSADIIRREMKKNRRILLIEKQRNEGRGSALSQGFQMAHGNIQIFTDVDLSIDIGLFDTVVRLIEEDMADIVVGSKHLKGASVEYPVVRTFFSKVYSFLVSMLFNCRIKDYQCGLKGFRKDVIRKLLPHIKNKRWSWDTEIIIKAMRNGFRVVELPAKVRNVYERKSKVSLIHDSVEMGKELFHIWLEVRKSEKRKRYGIVIDI
jgi:hypothetical protein